MFIIEVACTDVKEGITFVFTISERKYLVI